MTTPQMPSSRGARCLLQLSRRPRPADLHKEAYSDDEENDPTPFEATVAVRPEGAAEAGDAKVDSSAGDRVILFDLVQVGRGPLPSATKASAGASSIADPLSTLEAQASRLSMSAGPKPMQPRPPSKFSCDGVMSSADGKLVVVHAHAVPPSKTEPEAKHPKPRRKAVKRSRPTDTAGGTDDGGAAWAVYEARPAPASSSASSLTKGNADDISSPSSRRQVARQRQVELLSQFTQLVHPRQLRDIAAGLLDLAVNDAPWATRDCTDVRELLLDPQDGSVSFDDTADADGTLTGYRRRLHRHFTTQAVAGRSGLVGALTASEIAAYGGDDYDSNDEEADGNEYPTTDEDDEGDEAEDDEMMLPRQRRRRRGIGSSSCGSATTTECSDAPTSSDGDRDHDGAAPDTDHDLPLAATRAETPPREEHRMRCNDAQRRRHTGWTDSEGDDDGGCASRFFGVRPSHGDDDDEGRSFELYAPEMQEAMMRDDGAGATPNVVYDDEGNAYW